MQPELVDIMESAPRVVYFDNNATTRPLPEVVAAMADILGPAFGNPSSSHSGGERARRTLAAARDSVASLIGAPSVDLIFTSSGSEANNMVLFSGVDDRGLVTSSIEHSSVVKTASAMQSKGVPVCYVSPNRAGEIEPDAVAAAIGESNPSLVSIQWVNSETGVINRIAEIGQICRDAGVMFHTDAAQAVGKLDVDVRSLPIDFLTFTAHKYHGPAGVGIVYANDSSQLHPLIHGGDQEGGLRAGTENLAGIVGAGVAAKARAERQSETQEKLTRLRDHFESSLINEFPWIQVNGGNADRICNTTNLHFSGLDGQALVAQFDAVGIYCSQSSACTNLRPEPSYVLRAMGLSEKEAYASVRFSFGGENTIDELNSALSQMIPIVRKLRKILV